MRTARLLAGRYLLEDRLANGGMATVWRAHDEALARTVAVKVLHSHLAGADSSRSRFRREAVAAAKLSHPGIVRLYDTGIDGEEFLVMEFVDGWTLAELGALAPGQAAHVGERVLRALAYAHARGLVHRDIKPANLLVSRSGEVKIADFGIAKATYADDLTDTGQVLGTAAYVAPEQLRNEPITGLADQYATGCVLYELVSGVRPFEGTTPLEVASARLSQTPVALDELVPGLPTGFAAVIERMLARTPAERFADAAAAADALAPFADAHLHVAGTGDPLGSGRAGRERGEAARGDGNVRRLLVVPPGRRLVACGVLAAVAALVILISWWAGLLPRDPIAQLRAQELAESSDPSTAVAPGEAGAAPAGTGATAASEPRPLRIHDLTSFDPQGDGRERDRFLDLMTDGSLDSHWATERYHTAAFGNLKEGVGFVVDLGAPRTLGAVVLELPRPGISFQVRVAERPAEALGGWRPLATVEDAPGGTVPVELDEVRSRYLLLWVTGGLQPIGGQFSAEVAELEVLGV